MDNEIKDQNLRFEEKNGELHVDGETMSRTVHYEFTESAIKLIKDNVIDAGISIGKSLIDYKRKEVKELEKSSEDPGGDDEYEEDESEE